MAVLPDPAAEELGGGAPPSSALSVLCTMELVHLELLLPTLLLHENTRYETVSQVCERMPSMEDPSEVRRTKNIPNSSPNTLHRHLYLQLDCVQVDWMLRLLCQHCPARTDTVHQLLSVLACVEREPALLLLDVIPRS